MKEQKHTEKIIAVVIASCFFLTLLTSIFLYLVLNFPKNPSAIVVQTSPEVENKQTGERTVLELKFKNIKFAISGQNPDDQAFNYWSQTAQTQAAASVDELYLLTPNEKGDFYYLPSKDTFYSLAPSSYETWSLVDEAYLNKNIGTFNSTNGLKGDELNKTKNVCTKSTNKVGVDFFTTIDCRNSVSAIIEGVEKIVDDFFSSKCLYPYANGKYLLFSQDAASAGSNRDACAILNDLGFMSLEVVR